MEDRFGSMVLINAARRGERELREQCFCLRIGFAAARFIAERGVFAEGVPVLVRLIAQMASRFGMVVTRKLAAQAVPVVGALGGAAVNYAFIDRCQDVARAHFVVCKLERRYGKDTVRAAYERLSRESPAAA